MTASEAYAAEEVRMFDAFAITRHPYRVFAWFASTDVNAEQ